MTTYIVHQGSSTIIEAGEWVTVETGEWATVVLDGEYDEEAILAAATGPGVDLSIDYSPRAIRDHFEGSGGGELLDGITDEELLDIANEAINHEDNWSAYDTAAREAVANHRLRVAVREAEARQKGHYAAATGDERIRISLEFTVQDADLLRERAAFAIGEAGHRLGLVEDLGDCLVELLLHSNPAIPPYDEYGVELVGTQLING